MSGRSSTHELVRVKKGEVEELRAENKWLRAALEDAIDFIDPFTDPWLHITTGEMAKRLREKLGYQQDAGRKWKL